jgi:hypothetical protein
MKDILADFENKTIFKNGDINTGRSDEQHQRLLLLCEKGSFKEFPATCVGASTFLENEDADGLIREVRLQFQADQMNVSSVNYKGQKLLVDAVYGRGVFPELETVNDSFDFGIDEVPVIPGQTLVDIAMQVLGTEQRLFELADLNDCGICDDISGIVLCPQPTKDKQAIIKSLNLHKPSSMFIGIDNPAPEGIEYWAIENDFEVS